ncbi:unnamed protein product [Allacma fusca]|uniref:Alpha-tubulin N-acetyltransferase n=1 Tax=Allacma fusca TaxID=39272 RepID=A0A8J2KDU1_9HEXA|nr:unnamed protein product [Allacma fusca]
MEFGFLISDLFPSEISVVGSDLIPVGCPGLNKLGPQRVKTCLSEILDTMGKASATAQNLHQIITNSAKLEGSNGEQLVYFLCDLESNAMVGLLKIGRKKLFVFDQTGVQHEMNPMCILDFYVHESRQRMGCGRHLFEYMLHQEGVEVPHLAIDRPSDKFLFFFRKHYGLTQIIPQVNNFVVFDGFFTNRPDYTGKKQRWGGLDQVESPSDRLKRNQCRTQLQDSKNYNAQPGLFLRNPGAGALPSYSHVPHRHASSIGGVLHPPAGQNAPFYRSANNITPNYQTNGVVERVHQLHQECLYSPPEMVFLQKRRRDLKYSHEPLW